MPDLSLKPDFTFVKRTRYETIISQFENGAEQRRSRWANPLREWVLQFRNRSASDLSTIQDLFDAQKGQYGAFDWLNPLDAVTYTVRFKEETFEVGNSAYGFYDFQFELIEVR